MPRTATTGPAAYEAVCALIATGGKAATAFNKVAEDMGISSSSVAQSYYRYRKQYETGDEAVGPRPKRGRPAGSKNKSTVVTVVETSPKAVAKTNGTSDQNIAVVVSRLKDLLDAMVDESERDKQRVAALVAENEVLRAFRENVISAARVGG